MIAVSTRGSAWTPPVVLGDARPTVLGQGQTREAGSARCGLLDCWVYPLIGILVGGTLGAIGGVIAARKLED